MNRKKMRIKKFENFNNKITISDLYGPNFEFAFSFDWTYVESEGSNSLRFDLNDYSIWVNDIDGKISLDGNLPKRYKNEVTKKCNELGLDCEYLEWI
jgi:hypothetical protein